jgi:thiol:disulfide interchange protein DsbD
MNKFYGLLIALLSLNTLFVFGQGMEMPEDKVDWDIFIEQDGCDATVVAKIKVIKHWHINPTVLPAESFLIPTTFALRESNNFKKSGKVIEPKPVEKFDKESKEMVYYHEGSFTLKQKIKITSEEDFALILDFGFQPCDSVKCLMPYDEEINLQVKGCKVEEKEDDEPNKGDRSEENDEAINNLDKSDSIKGDNADSLASNIDTTGQINNNQADNTTEEKSEEFTSLKKRVENKSLLKIFILSFLSGFAALLTPCVFPMIPMTVSFFTKTSKTKTQGKRNALIYSVSIIVIYILLGTLVTGIFGAETLNEMSTNPTFNVIFFVLLVVFAVSFMGAFEIRLPSSWVNKADKQADRGGLIGIFFMALALALVSFSCTGPIVGTLLVQAAAEGGIAPFVGMFGFSLALALPFGLFAMFPGWLNSLPQSGGWLNTVKVVLGFLELALAFKFLSNADLSLQLHLIERELFLAIWIGIFAVLTLYLFGKISMPHDSPVGNLSVGRVLLGLSTFIFVIYMIPGLWGAPLKLISAFPPPMNYSESPLGFGAQLTHSSSGSNKEIVDGMHLGPQNIMVFDEFDKAKAHAEKVGKPLFIDFTGHNCVNCRKMEQSVWGEPGIIDILRDSVIIVSLHVDERIALPKEEQTVVTLPNGREKKIRTTGDKWMMKQITDYGVAAQPYYRMLDRNGNDLPNESADYENHRDPDKFKKWLRKGLSSYRKIK